MLSLAALADPTRRRIVELLAQGERSAGDIVTEFDISAPAISQHLKVLRTAKLVTVRIQGQHRIQSLDFHGIQQIEDWVKSTKKIWENRVDALEKQPKTPASPPPSPAPPPAPIIAPAPIIPPTAAPLPELAASPAPEPPPLPVPAAAEKPKVPDPAKASSPLPPPTKPVQGELEI